MAPPDSGPMTSRRWPGCGRTIGRGHASQAQRAKVQERAQRRRRWGPVLRSGPRTSPRSGRSSRSQGQGHGDQQHREAAVGPQGADAPEDLVLRDPVWRGRGFVGKHEVRSRYTRDGDGRPLPHPARDPRPSRARKITAPAGAAFVGAGSLMLPAFDGTEHPVCADLADTTGTVNRDGAKRHDSFDHRHGTDRRRHALPRFPAAQSCRAEVTHRRPARPIRRRRRLTRADATPEQTAEAMPMELRNPASARPVARDTAPPAQAWPGGQRGGRTPAVPDHDSETKRNPCIWSCPGSARCPALRKSRSA